MPQKASKSRFASVAFLFLAALFLVSSPGIAASAEDNNTSQSIRVVTDDNYPPYVFRDESGNLKGILVDQWALWQERTGLRVILTGMDWSEAQRRMQAGEFDVIDTIFRNEKRDKIYDFSRPYARLDVPLFFHRDLSGISGPRDLDGFLVAVKAGDAAIDVLRSQGVSSFSEYPSYEKIVAAARDGRVKVFCVDRQPALYFLEKMGIHHLFRETTPLYFGEFHRAVLKGQGGLLAEVEKGFAAISKAEYAVIDKRWMGAPLSANPYLRYAVYGLSGFVLLVAVLLVILWSLRRVVAIKTRELAASDEQHRLVLRTAMCGIWRADCRGKLLEVNPAYCRMSGYSEQELLTMQIADLEVLESAADIEERIRQLAQHGEMRFESRHRRKDGTVFDVEVSIHYQPIVGGECVAFLEDITERKRSREELKASAQQWQATFDASNDAIWILNNDNRVLRTNKMAERIFHLPAQELLGSCCFSSVHQSDEPHPDCPYQRARQSLQRETMELLVGEQWLQIVVDPIINSAGELEGAVHIVSDITERKQAEGEREALILKLQDKTAEQERFIYTLSHDLKSPLITITCFLDLLRENFQAGDETSFMANCATVGVAAQRMKQLIDELLELSRVGVEMNPAEVVNFGGLVDETLENLSGRISETGTIVEVASGLPDVLVDRRGLLSVLENLVDNAAKFSARSEGGSRVSIGIHQENGETVFHVRDNGVGIDPPYLSQVFGLFKKLDATSSGTGVGLAIVKRVIELHGGKIWVESEGLGQGSTFYFTLPGRAA